MTYNRVKQVISGLAHILDCQGFLTRTFPAFRCISSYIYVSFTHWMTCLTFYIKGFTLSVLLKEQERPHACIYVCLWLVHLCTTERESTQSVAEKIMPDE